VGPVALDSLAGMLDEVAKKLAQDPNFAAFTTLSPSGQPMTHVMWVDADDDHLLINTEVHRQKYTGEPYTNPITSERVILKVSPERTLIH
jgi:hypothetical protein